MAGLRTKLHEQLFVGAHPDGRLTILNRLLIITIVLAIVAAALSTEPTIPPHWHRALLLSEFVFGTVFLLEYLARIFAAAEDEGEGSEWDKRWRFIRSPLGIIDLLVVLSTLMPLIVADAAMLRMLRLMRVIAVMKFGRFSYAITELWRAISDRIDDLIITAAVAFILVLFGATALYMIEGHIQPEAFGSIPRALYWATVTLTTVGYGDVVPITPLGKVFAAGLAMSGIAFVAMPTGIIVAAFSDAMQRRRDHLIDDMRRHLEALDIEDEHIEAKIAALERSRSRPRQ
ncbi:ion transporter [Qipengyuania soli]|uniref:Ion transporter n=1 Tax=Qipengyuania soli TaxID=2782568 RepID=A0A7S8F385_9SPHN|nr:ion transporter [Qipengyuania soli]QPC98317.1 ion transporter [Qipengyuania soli]